MNDDCLVDMFPSNTPAYNKRSSSAADGSPLLHRQPFRNLSNMVLPMKKKLASFRKDSPATRSKHTPTIAPAVSAVDTTVDTTVETAVAPAGAAGDDAGDDAGDTTASTTHEPSSSPTADTTLEDAPSSPVSPSSPTDARFSRSFRAFPPAPAPGAGAEVFPPKAIRRIHSMYQTTKEKESHRMEDNSHLKASSIPTFVADNDLIPRIDEHTMHKIVCGLHDADFDEFIIVDCRFDYEYNGGHIDGAVNMSTKDALEHRFLASAPCPPGPSAPKRLLIFHCEFSVFRGPTMASHLRKCDRRLNSDNYPCLSFPDVVVLEGGYSAFWAKYKSSCSPQGYIEMKDVNYQQHCEIHMNKARQDSKLTRAKSFNQFAVNSDAQFLHRHSRSQSFTTITSEKILKRQKSIPKVKTASTSRLDMKLARASTFSNDHSVFNSSHASSASISSPIFSQFNHSSVSSIGGIDSDFQPPSASFNAGHRKSYSTANFSSSSASINSSSSSLCSESTCSSTEALNAPYSSPMGEFTDYFESKTNNLTNYMKSSAPAVTVNNASVFPTTASVLKPVSRKPSGPLPALPARPPASLGCNIQPNSFKFPNNLKPKTSRHSLNRLSTTTSKSAASTPLLNSSPIISSPLSTATPVSTIDSTLSNHASSIIDPINDTPVDFAVPFGTKSSRYVNHSRKISGSLLSSAGGGLYNFISLDIDEAGEQEDDEYANTYYSRRCSISTNIEESDDNEGTITDTKIPTYFQKSPFN